MSADEIKAPSLAPSIVALFASSATLVCCALPAALVALGAGAVMAGLVSAVPQLIWLGQNKALVFGLAGALLALAGAWQWRARSLPCPIEPRAAAACMAARRWGWRIWFAAVALFAIGGFFAFFAAALL
jgi:hypothetical protein